MKGFVLSKSKTFFSKVDDLKGTKNGKNRYVCCNGKLEREILAFNKTKNNYCFASNEDYNKPMVMVSGDL